MEDGFFRGHLTLYLCACVCVCVHMLVCVCVCTCVCLCHPAAQCVARVFVYPLVLYQPAFLLACVYYCVYWCVCVCSQSQLKKVCKLATLTIWPLSQSYT